MARILVVTVPYEGGYYSLRRDFSAPIRVYSDRWVEDDILKVAIGRARRERLTKNEYRKIRRMALLNAKEWRV